MTDKRHLDEFRGKKLTALSKQLVDTFVEGHRDTSVSSADLIVRLRDVMEQRLGGADDAAKASDNS